MENDSFETICLRLYATVYFRNLHLAFEWPNSYLSLSFCHVFFSLTFSGFLICISRETRVRPIVAFGLIYNPQNALNRTRKSCKISFLPARIPLNSIRIFYDSIHLREGGWLWWWMGTMWKKLIVASFKVLYRHFPTDTEQNHEKIRIAGFQALKRKWNPRKVKYESHSLNHDIPHASSSCT